MPIAESGTAGVRFEDGRVAVGGASREIGGRSPGRAVAAFRREDADGIANGCPARHERSAANAVTLVRLAEATVQDRQHVVLTMRPRFRLSLGSLALGKQKETIDASLWFR